MSELNNTERTAAHIIGDVSIHLAELGEYTAKLERELVDVNNGLRIERDIANKADADRAQLQQILFAERRRYDELARRFEYRASDQEPETTHPDGNPFGYRVTTQRLHDLIAEYVRYRKAENVIPEPYLSCVSAFSELLALRRDQVVKL